MNLLIIKKRIFLFILFFFSLFFSFSKNKFFENFIFEVSRYALTQTTLDSRAKNYYDLSKDSALILMLPVWKNSSFLYLYETFCPDRIGQIESSFLQSNLTALSNQYWIESTSISYNMSYDLINSQNSDLLSILDNKEGDENPEEKEIVNRLRNGTLRRFSYNGEIFSLSRFDNKNVLTNTSVDKIVRRIFDDDYKIIGKEVFNIPKHALDLKMKEKTVYEYNDDENFLSKVFTEDLSGKTEKEIIYNKDGNPVKETMYHFEIENNDTSENEKKYVKLMDYQKIWEYNDEKYLTKYTNNQYFSENQDLKTRTSVKKQVTEYKHNSFNKDDVYFYEDEKLRGKTIYTDTDDYLQYLFFDDDFCVKSEYSDGIKILEVILLNDKEIRRREFEKD